MNCLSDKAVRVALLDAMRQQDEMALTRLAVRMRNEQTAMINALRNIATLKTEMTTVQRRICGLAGQIEMEVTQNV